MDEEKRKYKRIKADEEASEVRTENGRAITCILADVSEYGVSFKAEPGVFSGIATGEKVKFQFAYPLESSGALGGIKIVAGTATVKHIEEAGDDGLSVMGCSAYSKDLGAYVHKKEMLEAAETVKMPGTGSLPAAQAPQRKILIIGKKTGILEEGVAQAAAAMGYRPDFAQESVSDISVTGHGVINSVKILNIPVIYGNIINLYHLKPLLKSANGFLK